MTAEELQRECTVPINLLEVKTFIELMRAYETLRANEAERAHEAAWEAISDDLIWGHS